MSHPAIRVEHVSKAYRVSHARPRHDTFMDAFAALIRRPFGKRVDAQESNETFWALRDVSFDVRPGEVVGIIGRNGAGKSTLLKILSRITAPTEGRVEIRGRVASLLEVGTGFHPELTGRENVYMNGSILGMSRAEIDKKFDEIVEFAGVDRFLDTPLKRYSSGMQLRLAFAVAAHLQPEILVIDEVLAVGDAAFQRKCLNQIGSVARSGRTVLFVSHNLAAVEALCSSAVVIANGKVAFRGTAEEGIARYVAELSNETADLIDRPDREGTGEVMVTAIAAMAEHGDTNNVVRAGESVEIRLRFRAQESNIQGLIVGIAVRTSFDAPVFLQHNELSGDELGPLPSTGTFVCRIPELPLVPAEYSITYSVMSGARCIDRIANAARFEVVPSDHLGSGRLPNTGHGPMLVRASWHLQP
jgi:lipopolysaccharide transport system ATP-binding protein